MPLKALAQSSARVERRSTPRFCIPSVVGQDCPSYRDVASKTCQMLVIRYGQRPLGLQGAGCPAGLLTSCVLVLDKTSLPVGFHEIPPSRRSVPILSKRT